MRSLGWLVLIGVGCNGAVSTETPEMEECLTADYACASIVIEARCLSCHSIALQGAARNDAPVGVDFDTENDLRRWRDRILIRAVVARTMPPNAALTIDERALLEDYLRTLGPPACVPSCGSRVCGDDGCGGSCGVCGAGSGCAADGTCTCAPSCDWRTCGDDGCGGSCGTCPSGQTCFDGGCVCLPNCGGRQCGDDGCGGSCGECHGQRVCNTLEGQCTTDCIPDCSGRACGDDGCGGTCGECPGGEPCNAGACGATGASFAGDVLPILQAAGCDAAGCHSGSNPQADLDLSQTAAYQELTSSSSTECIGTPLVSSGEPASSYLINKLTGFGMCEGSQMPKGQSPLSSAELDVVRAWISGGAAN